MTIDELRSLQRPTCRTEVARFLECDVRTVDRAIADGTIKSFRIGRKVYIPTQPFIQLAETGGYGE
jgi:excisionase family DNA binding protein